MKRYNITQVENPDYSSINIYDVAAIHKLISIYSEEERQDLIDNTLEYYGGKCSSEVELFENSLWQIYITMRDKYILKSSIRDRLMRIDSSRVEKILLATFKLEVFEDIEPETPNVDFTEVALF